MAQKPYFCAYHSYLGSIATLNDAERGRLFTAAERNLKGGGAWPAE